MIHIIEISRENMLKVLAGRHVKKKKSVLTCQGSGQRACQKEKNRSDMSGAWPAGMSKGKKPF